MFQSKHQPEEQARPRPVTSSVARAIAMALTLTFGLAACGDAAGNTDDTAAAARVESEPAAEAASQKLLIRTRVVFASDTTGDVLDGSLIGDSPFCAGGTLRDQHGTGAIGAVDRTIRCPDGTVRIGFDPGEPVGRTQAGPWRIISGTGAFEDLEGSGQMEISYPRGDDRKGRETFTGTVTGLTGVSSAEGDRLAEHASHEIRITTRVDFGDHPTGDVVDGSMIGDSPFCAGGTFTDAEGAPAIGVVDRTIRCDNGTLRIGFDPGPSDDRALTEGCPGGWRVISGTGAFEHLEGNGRMDVSSVPDTDPLQGRETFTGNITGWAGSA